MEKILSEKEKQRINALLEKHRPREGIQEKEMVVLSEKGKEISIKTEVASSSMKPFEDRPIEHEEEASKRKYEVIGTDIEMEYEEMDTEDEEREVRKLTKEELEIYHQYKEFYTIQARTKGKMPGFGYIHRLKVKERYPGVPTDLVKTFSHPIEGEVQDINRLPEQEVIKIEQKHAMVPRRQVNIRPEKKTIILCIDPDSDSDVVIEEEGDFRERCIITRRNEEMNEMLKKGQNKQMMNNQNHSPQKELSLEHLWLLIRKLKTKMKQFPVLQLRILIEKRWRGNSSTWPPIINRSEKVLRNW